MHPLFVISESACKYASEHNKGTENRTLSAYWYHYKLTKHTYFTLW